MEENKPKVLIRYKEKLIPGQKEINNKYSVKPDVDLTDWVYVDRIDPTAYPNTLKVRMPNGKEFTIIHSEIDIVYGDMAGVLFEPEE